MPGRNDPQTSGRTDYLPTSLKKAALECKAEQGQLGMRMPLFRQLKKHSPGPRRPPCFKPCALSRLSRYHPSLSKLRKRENAVRRKYKSVLHLLASSSLH